ncbi:MAG: hypothetical protein KJP26_14125 [Maribacter sp.]|nr:hypothetical protein [Maribacter sp.]NNK18533.1 hypothetical protein [Maribacter sp.]
MDLLVYLIGTIVQTLDLTCILLKTSELSYDKMERYYPDFLSQLGDFNLEVLERSEYSIYALSRDLRFTYFNPAWFRFATKNGFDKAAAKKLALGSSVLKWIRGLRLKCYLRNNYKKVIRTGKIWHFDYECSSPSEYRLFHQIVHPLYKKSGVLIINTEMFKLPMSTMNRKTFRVIEDRYIQSDGQIVHCGNCRHTRRADEPDLWDWVPEWIDKLPANYRLSICPTCEHLYKET